MNPYIFLFALALLFTIFATIQDLKKREVANWLNFSLIAFALAFRAFYSIINSSIKFFILGVVGLLIFIIIANLLYYGKVFAGGDAKLLMSFGIILPYSNYLSLITLSLTFVLLLLITGAIYSLIYSISIIAKNKNKFKNVFAKKYNKHKIIINISIVLLIISILVSIINSISLIISPIFLIPILLIYTSSLDKCLTILTKPKDLTEGDWIEHDIKLTRKITIKKTVHGLSKEDIQLLRKYKKSIIVKQGIPFVPAFLISLIILIVSSSANNFSILNLNFLP